MFSQVDPLLVVAVVLGAGVVGGRIARSLGVPGITGQIVAGVLIGHSGFDLFSGAVLAGLEGITEFSLAFIAVLVGSHLQFARLHNAGRRLFFMLLTEATITPLVTFLAIISLGGGSWEMGLLLATMAVSTAPATILCIVSETRSKGVFVKTLVAAVALNNVACIVLFEVARAWTRPEGPGGGTPFLLLLAAVALGVACGFLLVWSTQRTVRRSSLATASLAAILAAAGIAATLEMSQMLTCLVLGSTVANLAPRRENLGAHAFDALEGVIFTIFFTLAGAHLELALLVQAGALAIAVLLGRAVGKLIAADLAMRLGGAPERVRQALGRALLPQAGVAVGLLLVISHDPAFALISKSLLAVGLSTVMVNELVGPFMTRRALARSGDLGRDRPRVIDFIQEEHIEMKLHASTMEEAIVELSDLLIRTNRLTTTREAFIASVLEREASASTCVGGGLAVPHARLEGREEIAGVIGISREGLQVPTPDGLPVHCIVLLATTDSLIDRHLEVLAALARAISSHHDLGHRLFTARSPAHVYELLHAEESESFNAFLEEPA